MSLWGMRNIGVVSMVYAKLGRFLGRALRKERVLRCFMAQIMFGKKPQVLVVLPAGVGSLGDQAMLQSVADHLGAKGGWTFRQVLMPGWGCYSVAGSELPCLRFDLDQVRKGDQALLDEIKKSAAVVAIGADVIDGIYGTEIVEFQLRLLHLAAGAGIPAAMLGHSFSEKPAPLAVDMLSRLPSEVAVHIRDQISLQRFEASTRRSATLVADLAFAVQPDMGHRAYRHAMSWTERCREGGALILCLNVNGLTVDKHGGEAGAIDYWSRFLKVLWHDQPKLGVLFVSHDDRPGVSDAALHEKIIERLQGMHGDQIFSARALNSAAQAKAVAGLADVTLTGRMHLAIGALSMSVPTFCVEYAGKFQGVARHFGISDFVFPEKILQSPEMAADWFVERLPTLSERRSKLVKALPRVIELSRRNFDFLESDVVLEASVQTGYTL